LPPVLLLIWLQTLLQLLSTLLDQNFVVSKRRNNFSEFLWPDKLAMVENNPYTQGKLNGPPIESSRNNNKFYKKVGIVLDPVGVLILIYDSDKSIAQFETFAIHELSFPATTGSSIPKYAVPNSKIQSKQL